MPTPQKSAVSHTPGPKLVGITDTVCTCDCCGRTDLKHTVILKSDVHETVSHMGVACAARAMGRKTSKSVLAEAMDAQILADREEKHRQRAEAQAAEKAARRERLLQMSREDFGTGRLAMGA